MHLNPDHFLETAEGRVITEERNAAAWRMSYEALDQALSNPGPLAKVYVLVGSQGAGKSAWVRSQKWLRLFEQLSPTFKWTAGGLQTVQSCPRRRASLATNARRGRELGAHQRSSCYAASFNVRQWLVGRGMKRCGVEQAAAANAASALSAAPVIDASPVMPFVPVQLPAPAPAPAGAQPHRLRTPSSRRSRGREEQRL